MNFSSSHSQTHTVGIDVLRGVAILMVIAIHSFGPFFGDFVPWNGWLPDFAHAPSAMLLWCYPITFGWGGVALFFVISGFCIHYSFLRAGRFGIGVFAWRRLWRICPAYFFALLVFALYAGVQVRKPEGFYQFFTHVLFVQNFADATFFTINPSFWSIATEVQLYLLYPLLLGLRSRFGIGNCFLITLVVGCLWRAVVVFQWGLPDRVISPALTSPLMTWSDWTLGAVLAERFAGQQRRIFGRPRVWLGVFAVLMIGSTFYKPFTIFSFSLAAACSAVLLEMALVVDWTRHRWSVLLAFVGAVSYSLYLWHQPLIVPITRAMPGVLPTFLAWMAAVACLLAIAYASFRLVETTGIKVGAELRRRFFR